MEALLDQDSREDSLPVRWSLQHAPDAMYTCLILELKLFRDLVELLFCSQSGRIIGSEMQPLKDL